MNPVSPVLSATSWAAYQRPQPGHRAVKAVDASHPWQERRGARPHLNVQVHQLGLAQEVVDLASLQPAAGLLLFPAQVDEKSQAALGAVQSGPVGPESTRRLLIGPGPQHSIIFSHRAFDGLLWRFVESSEKTSAAHTVTFVFTTLTLLKSICNVLVSLNLLKIIIKLRYRANEADFYNVAN